MANFRRAGRVHLTSVSRLCVSRREWALRPESPPKTRPRQGFPLTPRRVRLLLAAEEFLHLFELGRVLGLA